MSQGPRRGDVSLRARKPPWFKVPAPGGPRYRELTALIADAQLHTVCQEAACPNVGECWERGTATFMILGDTCTRRCGFCNVKTGKPTWHDPLEPARVARSVARMGLRHAVITSVDRDDLPDLGASAFVGVIREIRRQAPECQIEVLTPISRARRCRSRASSRRDRMSSTTTSRSCRGFTRRAPRLAVPALGPRAAQRQGTRRRRADDQVRADGRTRRDPRGDGRDLRGAARARRPGADDRAVPAPQRAAPADRALLAPRRVRCAGARRLPARLRARRRRPAGALVIPRRPARPAGETGVGPLAAAATNR